MFIEIFKEKKAYRGKQLERDDNTITLLDALNNCEHKISLEGQYILTEYGDEKKESEIFEYILDYVKLAANDNFLTSKDKEYVLSSTNVIETYQIIKTLRVLDFNFNSLNDLTPEDVKEKLKYLLEEEYNYNLLYINQDNDLTESEKEKLILTIDRSKCNYLNVLENLIDIVTMFEEFPPMFNDKLLYLGDVVNIIKYGRELANLRAAHNE